MKTLNYCAAAFLVAGSLWAQSPPYAIFQNATLSGTGNTITATQVPVVTAVGTTVYVNFSVQFNPDATGNLTVVPGSLQVSLAPAMIASSFKAGTYVTGSNTLAGKGAIIVSGPAVTDGGATVWTITAAPGADSCTYPSNAVWYVGPLTSSPYAARLKTAGLTSTAFSYGSIGSQACASNNWNTNGIVGLTQVGNSLNIVSFTVNVTDKATAVDQITYTLKP